jgi:CO/xanthine dehydrogenase Mo-binding subunit
MSSNKYVGKSVHRNDAFEKVTGAAVYGADIKLPRQLYGAIYRSPLPHARILNIDTSLAKAVPGVRAVVTGEDYHFLYGSVIADEPFLAYKKVRYAGEPVVAVAAEDPETAAEAARLVKVDYEELPVVLDPVKAAQPGSPLVHDDWEQYQRLSSIRPVAGTNIRDLFTMRRGDVEAAWKEADVILENEYKSAALQHVTIETHCATAMLDSRGLLTLWGPFQSPFFSRQHLAKALKMPLNKVRIVVTYIGGGFGSKFDMVAEKLAAILALKVRGRPVKVVFEREDDFLGSTMRGATVIRIKTGAKKDGTLVAQEVKSFWDTGAYTFMGPRICNAGSVVAGGPYIVPNIKVDAYSVCTNKPSAGAYRGFGAPEGAWAYERQMDALAQELGIDPLELRLHNALEEGSISVMGEQLFSIGLKESLLEAGKHIGWQSGKLREVMPDGKIRGKGIACFWKMTSSPSNSAVLIKMNDDGTVTVIKGGTEMGQGVNTIIAQIAAGELGIAYEKVLIAPIDTAITPYDKSSTGSRLTFHIGNATILAAKDAKEQLKRVAAKAWQVPVEQVDIEDGVIVEKTPDGIGRKVVIDKIGESGILKEQATIVGRGTFCNADIYVPPDVETKQSTRPAAFWMYGAQAAEVEVDPETGTVEVLKIVAAHDCGKAINPQLCVQQIEGSFVMGLGSSLLEEIIFDDKGQVRNANMVDYKVPTSMDFVMDHHVSLVEANHREGPFGAKGIGEPAIVPTAPAVGNAISHAVGLGFMSIPIKPEKILEGIKRKGG